MSKIVILTRGPSYNVPGFGALSLGENVASDEMVAFMAGNRTIRRDISAGVILIGHGAADPEPADAPEPEPEPVDPHAALRALAAGDKRRKEVREAIDQLAAIEGDGA